MLRLLFLGDIVGEPGRKAVIEALPWFKQQRGVDFVVVNGENAAHGFGITEEIFLGFLAAGADVVTLGNHSFDQREALIFIERYPNLLRPVNWPRGCPGAPSTLTFTAAALPVRIVIPFGKVLTVPAAGVPSNTIRPLPSVTRVHEGPL